MSIEFEEMGLDAIEAFLDDYPTIERTILESQGKMLRVAIYNNLRSQKFNGPTAKLATIQRKLAKNSNFPTDVWRDVGVIQANVESRWIGSEDDPEVGVGWYEEVVGKDRIIAVLCLEYGSVKRNIAARPLVRPTVDAMAPRLEDDAFYRLNAIAKDLNGGRYRGVQA